MIRIDKYGIETTEKCFTVGKIATRIVDKQTGAQVEYLAQPAYYSSLAGCLRAIRRRMRMDALASFDGDLASALEVLRQMDEHFTTLVSDLSD